MSKNDNKNNIKNDNFKNDYKLVLGLEIHLHLKTKSKMFCGCSADIWKKEPNSLTCPTCLGLPGALPVPNKEAIEKTHVLGLSLGCKINKISKFDRKHYFYPDLPKGYQISQYKQPLCEGGQMKLNSGNIVNFERIHLEEDTAKSFHEGGKTLIDFNKCGMPLVEVVTKPEIKTIEDAYDLSQKIQYLVRYLGISDADMEKGQLRVEPNISLRTQDDENKGILPDYKVEIKNINSFKFMVKAVEAEIKRQAEILNAGGKLKQENRGYDEFTGKTKEQRTKEEAKDYRYFPEPDIPPMEFNEIYIEKLSKNMVELPEKILKRLINDYKIPEKKAERLVFGFEREYIEKFLKLISSNNIDSEKAVNNFFNQKGFCELTIKEMTQILLNKEDMLEDEDILEEVIGNVLKSNSGAVEDYRNGKESAVQFLIGMVMKETRGKANPSITKNIIRDKVKTSK